MSDIEPVNEPYNQPWYKKKQIIIPLGLIVALLLAVSLTGGNNNDSSTDSSSTSATAEDSPTPTPSPTAPEFTAAEIATAKANIHTQTDEVKGIKWYYDITSPRDFATWNNAFYLYVGDAGGGPNLRFRINYLGNDWLFIQGYTLNVDGQVYEISADSSDVTQHNGIVGGEAMVWEWWDTVATSDNIDMIKAIISSKKTLLRYEGKDYHFDRTITAQEKRALAHVLAYNSSLNSQ